jgi:hypothetical protein
VPFGLISSEAPRSPEEFRKAHAKAQESKEAPKSLPSPHLAEEEAQHQD